MKSRTGSPFDYTFIYIEAPPKVGLFLCPFTFFGHHIPLLKKRIMPYKVDSVTGEKSEYIFDFGGILALKNFTARTNGERLIIQSATNANFTILDALVSEVQIDGVVYDNPTSAQEALQRLVFNPAVPVIMTLAQQQLLEGALQKGTYSGTASDLKTLLEDLIAQKVNKEENKGLISDTERTLIQENYNKRVVGQTITGDVNKVSTLILEDGSVIQAQFTDVAPAGPDVMLNSLNFNIQTGVLTGVRSDGQQLTVDLNGRYALLGHIHQIADVTGLEDALKGKAEAGHTHAFSDLSGTEDIATKQEITDAVSGIKIGGRNFVLNSDFETSSENKYSPISSDFQRNLSGTIVTLSFDILIKNLTTGGRVGVEIRIDFQDGTHQFVNAWKNFTSSDIGKNFKERFSHSTTINNKTIRTISLLGSHIQVSAAEAKLGRPKAEKGNIATDWYSAPEDFPSKSELEDVIDVDTIDEIGDFKPKSGNIRPHISPTGNFSVFAGEIGSGELLMQVDRTFGIKSPKHIDGKVVSGRKLRVSVIDSSWVDLDSRNNELNVTNPSNENDYVSVKAKGFKTPNGSVNEVLRADGSTALFMKGEEISGSVSWTANNRVRGNTIFLTGNGDKTIHLHQLENHSIMSFKKCYDGGVVTFQCSGKTIVMRGADAFNGKDGSNAVISIVGNKCYIDINNYE
ncbi:hypothetical protein ACILFS_00990 [Capnocytophaga canimorsus]|uniref:hypothetical protein n=1 Tax=Capnocytophaga canimorsus TaxID=28188 RepID=UPI0037D2F131